MTLRQKEDLRLWRTGLVEEPPCRGLPRLQPSPGGLRTHEARGVLILLAGLPGPLEAVLGRVTKIEKLAQFDGRELASSVRRHARE